MTDAMTRCIHRSSPLSLDLLTFHEIEQELRRFPAIVVPLGGCEPACGSAPVGISSLCASAVAAELSFRHRILLAPLLAYGCSVPYSSFEGCSGTRERTFINTIVETITIWARQGARFFLLIDGLSFNAPAIETAARRIRNSRRGAEILCVSLQREGGVLEFAGRHFKIGMPALASAVMLSLAAFLEPALIGSKQGGRAAVQPDANAYRVWAKRGMDPQRLRKLLPEGPMAPVCDAGFGGELFEFIVQSAGVRIDALRSRAAV